MISPVEAEARILIPPAGSVIYVLLLYQKKEIPISDQIEITTSFVFHYFRLNFNHNIWQALHCSQGYQIYKSDKF